MNGRGILVDTDISLECGFTSGLNIEPYNEENVQPGSYDLTLGDEFIFPDDIEADVLGLDRGKIEADARVCDSVVLDPGDFVLGHTVEYVEIPDDITGEVKGRSTLGRMGLIPHTAGWIDPGFEGQITLELKNHGKIPVEVKPGQRIAQMVIQETRKKSSRPYGERRGSKYNGQTGATMSRAEKE